MSTSFPNNNGNVPPYNNPQANGSFNQFGQGGPPPGPGGFPGMDPYSMYGNSFGGMPPGQPPPMGAPPQPGGPKGQQYPGTGAKPPGYDGMQNGYMQGYRPPNGQAPMPPPNGPPAPNYNMTGNPYDPYRMYSGMPGPGQQAPTSTSSANRPTPTPPAPQRPPSQQQQQPPNQYPAQQPLPAHLHPGGPSFPNSASGSTPLQHYQPPNYMAQQPNARTTALPSLQSPNSSKPAAPPKNDVENRPNSFGGTFPNQPYAGFGGPSAPGSGASTPSGYPPYGGYMGFGPSPGQPTAGTPTGQPPQQGFGNPGSFNPGFGASGPGASNAPNPVNPFGQNHFGANGNPGGQTSFENGKSTPGNANFGAAPAPGTPGTPGAHGHMPSAPTQSPLAQNNPQSSQNAHQPTYGQNNLMSPNQGNGNNMKPPARSPMGSSLPPLNGQYPGAPQPTHQEHTFKEPAMPIRQSPNHPPPQQQPPAYHAQPQHQNQHQNPHQSPHQSQPSTTMPKPEQQRAPSPTFAVPTLPAAATLAQASSANQVSTKPRTSPQKKKFEELVPEPPNSETPFTTVTHYELPVAMANLRDALVPKNPSLDKYFARKRQPLRWPYPEGMKVQTAAVTEPDTFGFMQGTKYYEHQWSRGLPTHPPPHMMHSMGSMGPPMPPMLSRSQSMHTPMISPGYTNAQQAMQQQASTSGRQPAKKARSSSDASEQGFNVPLPPSSRQGMRPNDPRQMQMQQQMHFNQQQQMQKMQQQQQQQQHMAQQQYMARMGHGGPSGVSPAQGVPGPSNMPPPALQRAESMPALPSQPPMGGHMPPMQMNGNQKGPMLTNNTGHNSMVAGLPPLTLGSHPTDGSSTSNNFQSTSNHAQVRCAGCNHFILRGSATLCCMYHACKNVYHRECTRLSPSAYSQIEQETPHARWVCPTCEPQVRPAPPPPSMQMQHA